MLHIYQLEAVVSSARLSVSRGYVATQDTNFFSTQTRVENVPSFNISSTVSIHRFSVVKVNEGCWAGEGSSGAQ